MADFEHLKEWLRLSDNDKLVCFKAISDRYDLKMPAVEKDWWITQTLAIIFSMDCSKSLIFKGGTSLSKAWKIIERFSEDIDLALNREFLGFAGELSKTQIGKLRYASYNFLTEKFTPELQQRFNELGFADVLVKYREAVNHDQDPLVIEIYYPKLTEKDIYLRPGVLVEIGSRSLKEPVSLCKFKTLVAENYGDKSFADNEIAIPTVNVERTFLEKVFLLHEEYQRPAEKRRVERLSRHLYDIEKISRTLYFEKALSDKDLYKTIVAHRDKFSHLGGVDYAKHRPQFINIIPPKNLLSLWEKDYAEMSESMIYGEKLRFNELIINIKQVNEKINRIEW
jgi:hypothetical protein